MASFSPGTLERRDPKSGIPSSGPLLFVHIPKTAGTSFRNELEECFGKKAVFPGRWYLRRRYRQHYPDIASFKRDLPGVYPQLRAVTGHYPYALLKLLLPGVPRSVFLREPIARSISYLEHARARSQQYRGMSLEVIAGLPAQRPNPQVDNLQTRLLCSKPHPEGRLASALGNLQDFEFIGITECYSASIALCNYVFDLGLKGVRHDNAGRRQGSELSRELLAFLAAHNREDIELYCAAREIFRQMRNRMDD